MNKKELKSVIKEMVRQSLMEIFAEMHLETIVESVVKRQKPVSTQKQQTLKEQFVVEEERVTSQRQTKPAPKVDEAKQKAMLREELRKKMGVSEQSWNMYYSDIDPTKLPPGASSPGGNENPESVPEDLLEAAGLMRDYSDFIK